MLYKMYVIKNYLFNVIANNGLNKFYIEGWDALNNKSNLELDLYIINNISKPDPIIDKIFPSLVKMGVFPTNILIPKRLGYPL